jgi:hypothetical protein
VDEDPDGSGLYAFTEYTAPVGPSPDTGSDQVVATLGGIPFGFVDQYGVDWSLRGIDGWAATGSTAQTAQKPRQSGGWSGDKYATPRSLALNGAIFAPDAPALQAAIDRLNAACSLEDTPLVVTEAGFSRWCMVHRTGPVIAEWQMPTSAVWSIQVQSDDWRKFGQELTGTTWLPSTTGGLTIPYTIPYTINAVTHSGQVNLTNPGNAAGPVRLRIDGPVVGPVITHVSSGTSLVFSSSLVLGAGEWLDIDMEARTVLANGQASRAGWVTSRGWANFTPGENTWTFTAAQFNAGSQLTVIATPSWQ